MWGRKKPPPADMTRTASDPALLPIVLKGREANDPGIITDGNMALALRNELPVWFQLNTTWTLLYSTFLHGYSFNTLLERASKYKSATVLAVKTTKGKILGGFASSPWEANGQFHGTGECLLWSMSSMGKVNVYRWVGRNHLYMAASPKEYLAMGGGDGKFGLWIDETLSHGHSASCDTFHNPPLAGEVDFDILGVELWAVDNAPVPIRTASSL